MSSSTTFSFKEWILYYIQLFISLDVKSSHRLNVFITNLRELWITRNNKVFRNQLGTFQSVLIIIEEAMDQRITTTPLLKVLKWILDLHLLLRIRLFLRGFFHANIGREDVVDTTISDASWMKTTRIAGMDCSRLKDV